MRVFISDVYLAILEMVRVILFLFSCLPSSITPPFTAPKRGTFLKFKPLGYSMDIGPNTAFCKI